MRGKRFWILSGLCAVGLVGLASAGISYSSSTDFCLSCHEMRVHQKELAQSSHARDYNGSEIDCSLCHIPNANIVRMLAAKGWMGLKDLWVHNTRDVGNLDRAEMQPVARRFTDDANCLSCHDNLTQNAKKDGPISAEGKLAHANYLGENGQSRSRCVGCHINLAHLPVFDMRIPVNQKFAARLEESKS